MTSIKDDQYIATLFEFYKPLLTDKQQAMMYDHYFEDISLSEIADNYQISRSAVHDTLKRCTHLLKEYEDKLHLEAKYQKRMETYLKIQAYNNNAINALVQALLENEE